MEGVTSYNNGHIHYYTDYTGPAVYIDGGHYHNYMGETQVADRHTHRFSGRTSVYRD
ncbi:YmaF family protein [Ruminiclostridium cellobioparum]|uniref:YmaF family protein n=1 Tax=Ruminiclostridium cellobioparum TaxID=29355 RepID=UPI0009FD3A04